MKTKREMTGPGHLDRIAGGKTELFAMNGPVPSDAFGIPCSGPELVCLGHMVKPNATHEQASKAIYILLRKAKRSTKVGLPTLTVKERKRVGALINFDISPEEGAVGLMLLERIMDLTSSDKEPVPSASVALLLRLVRDINDPDWVHSKLHKDGTQVKDIHTASIYAGETEAWVEPDDGPYSQDPNVFHATPAEMNTFKRFIKPGVTHKQAMTALKTLLKQAKSGDGAGLPHASPEDKKKLDQLFNFNMSQEDGYVGLTVMSRILALEATKGEFVTDAGVATLLRFAQDLRNPEWAARMNQKLREVDTADKPKVH
jgi:hypothetical protein